MIIDMGYWTKVIRRIIILIFSVIGIYLAFKLSVFYMPFLIAFIISLLMEPAIKFLMKKLNFKRRTSSIIIFIIVIALVTGTLVWGITTIISEATKLLQGFNDYFDKAYIQVQEIISNIKLSKIQLSEQVSTIVQNSTNDLINNISAWAKNTLNALLNIVTEIPTIAIYVVITLLSLYFICTDKIYMIDQFEHHLPKEWVKKIWIHLKDITKTLGCYLKAQAILIIVSFVISIIGLYIYKIVGLNVEYPLLMALGIGFVDALPILGSGTVMVPWAIISAVNGDLHLGLAILILWGIMSAVRQIIEPRIVSHQIGIHPIFTLIAMYTGFKFIGIMGMIIGPIVLIIFKNIFATLIDRGVLKAIFDR
mgnify:CR=1 FL=1